MSHHTHPKSDAPQQPVQPPTIGRIVLYSLSATDVEVIALDRSGNAVAPGNIYPMLIVRVWQNQFGQGRDGVCGTVFLDWHDTYWKTGAQLGDAEGTWQWPTAAAPAQPPLCKPESPVLPGHDAVGNPIRSGMIVDLKGVVSGVGLENTIRVILLDQRSNRPLGSVAPLLIDGGAVGVAACQTLQESPVDKPRLLPILVQVHSVASNSWLDIGPTFETVEAATQYATALLCVKNQGNFSQYRLITLLPSLCEVRKLEATLK
jgi:hypothetical protein